MYAQQMLNHALSGGMHIDVPENGVFNDAFAQEVNGFKARHGLSQNGVIDHDTWAALHQAANTQHQAAVHRAAQEDAHKAEKDADDADHLSSSPHEVHSAPGHEND